MKIYVGLLKFNINLQIYNEFLKSSQQALQDAILMLSRHPPTSENLTTQMVFVGFRYVSQMPSKSTFYQFWVREACPKAPQVTSKCAQRLPKHAPNVPRSCHGPSQDPRSGPKHIELGPKTPKSHPERMQSETKCCQRKLRDEQKSRQSPQSASHPAIDAAALDSLSSSASQPDKT